MEVDMDTSPGYFDPQDLAIREQFRRYGKRHSASSGSPHQESSVSKFSESRLFYEGQKIHSPTNAALFLENIKQEVESFDTDRFERTPSRPHSSIKRRSSVDSDGIDEADVDFDTAQRLRSQSLKACKIEDDSFVDSGETTFPLFASLLDSSIQGLMPIPDLILRFERSCRNVSESIRYGSNIRHRVVEDKLMRQKAQLLLDEAASWSLLWYLYGKATEELPEELILSPSTSHLEACLFVANDHNAQLCLRIVQWLEGLASKALVLENKVRGSHVGTYLPNSGVWHHTQRHLKKNASNLSMNIVHHLDFDAPTRENSNIFPDDKKQEESLLEDVWTLLRAGRLEEACDLCRSAGQPWRASTLSPFGGLDLSPSVEALEKNKKNRSLQAIELESGIGHQWRLWKWASFCASEKIAGQDGGKYEVAVFAAQCSNLKCILPICTDWEAACWAMARSWLDAQVDVELARSQPGRIDLYGNVINESPDHMGNNSQSAIGPENWPLQVLNEQPRQLSALLQKLHSGDTVHEAVVRGCREQHRQIEMSLMLGDIPRVLELIWSWIAPSEGDQNAFRPHGDPQMIRFGAHLVLVLRYLLRDEIKDDFREKLLTVGDLILHMYAMFLFSKQHEELVGIYASQLARHRCIDLFVHMMELRLNSSAHVKYKIFLSAMEYLPYSPSDDSKGSFEEIIERVLARSREMKVGKYDKPADVAEQHRLQSLQKAMVIHWLCFTPPSTINDVKAISTKLLLRALIHSNILFREFALVSMWRTPALPVGAHALLSFLAEPLKQLSESPNHSDAEYVSEMKEFQDWSEYYSCDATYRNFLKIEQENAEVSPQELSLEEKQRACAAAEEALDSSFALLRKKDQWLCPADDHTYNSSEHLFLELHATAMLCLPSGECLCPDAAMCTALMSALYSTLSEDDVLKRQLMVNVAISSRDNYCIEVVLRCLAVEGDGLGSHESNDGGLLGTIMAAGFKGELVRFQAGVTMEISRLDAWYSSKEGSLEGSATYVLLGLCRRCCLPEVILRCMQVSVSLVESGNPPTSHNELIELVACPETGFSHLFSQQQLQEFLLLEREYSICKMELEEQLSD